MASKPSAVSTAVSAFRRIIELMLMLAAALAALFFYKSAEEKEKERERLEKARICFRLRLLVNNVIHEFDFEPLNRWLDIKF